MPAPDAQTRAASYPAVVSSTPSNSSIRSFVVEELGPPAALGSRRTNWKLPRQSSRESQDGRTRSPPLKSTTSGRTNRGFAEEPFYGDSRLSSNCSKVLSDGVITGVGQAEFAQSCRPPRRRHVVRRGDWQEPSHQNLQDFLARQFSAERLSDDCTAATQDRDQHALQG